MRTKEIELNGFKRFTHLSVEDIPETTKLVILVGPNGSGKTSFMEAMKIVDWDDRSAKEVSDLASKGIKVLKERNLESYLLDDTVLKKLCDSVGKTKKYEECLCEKRKALVA